MHAMTPLKRCMALALAAWLGLGAWSAGAQLLLPPPVRPDALVKAATSEVLAILQADLAAGRPSDVAQLAERVLPLFDFRRMTSLAVARDWRLASPQQQEALVRRAAGRAL